ncbi:MAG: glycoside hydrolase family 6 protein [Pseudomonadota bacterium]
MNRNALALSLLAAGAVVSCASPSGAGLGVSASPVEPAPAAHAPPDVNPFVGARIYANPDYVDALRAVEARHPESAGLLKKMASLPTAIWLSAIADTKEVSRHLEAARAQETALGTPVVTVFVVYDLPGRDCNAESSAGELPSDATGEARYRHELIDPIVSAFRAHPDERIVVIVEPDSLSNLVTNMSNPRCAAVSGIYKRGIAYAVAKLSQPNVFLYLDAAHAGWLGWPKNLARSVPLYKEVLEMAGGADRVRGFALNVSNYDPVKVPTSAPRDPAVRSDDELGYLEDLTRGLAKVGITGKGFVIDTSRNGRANVRSDPGSWCNVKGAGLGERPRARPAPSVDAYLFLKVPGESDGTSDPKAPRFDAMCGADDAAPGAPQAGKMFDSYLLDLLRNAEPPL